MYNLTIHFIVEKNHVLSYINITNVCNSQYQSHFLSKMCRHAYKTLLQCGIFLFGTVALNALSFVKCVSMDIEVCKLFINYT